MIVAISLGLGRSYRSILYTLRSLVKMVFLSIMMNINFKSLSMFLGLKNSPILSLTPEGWVTKYGLCKLVNFTINVALTPTINHWLRHLHTTTTNLNYPCRVRYLTCYLIYGGYISLPLYYF